MPSFRLLGAALLAAAVLVLPCTRAAHALGNGRLQIIHLDVGQGDGTLIITPNGQTALIDEGPGGTPVNGVSVVNQIKALGVTHIDDHFTSHYHSDHIGNFSSVFNGGVALDYGWDRAQSYTTQTYSTYVSVLGARRRTLVKNQVITLDSLSAHPVRIKCVDLAGAGLATSDENSLSLVLKVSYGEFDELIGGDLQGTNSGGGVDVESVVASAIGPIEVYKVHHHGSKYSSNTAFLNTIHPKIGVIQCGNGNSYGHPTAEAVLRLHQTGVRTYWTETGSGVAPDPAWDKVANGQIAISAGWEPGAVDTVRGGSFVDVFTNSGASGDTIAPVVALTAPTGGQNWSIGSSQLITWTASDNTGVSEVDLAYSTNGGASFPFAIASSLPNTGSYNWTLPLTPSAATRVRVRVRDAAGNLGSDSSATSFTMYGWTITASAGPNGTISPAGATYYGDGATPTYVMTPSPGYHVADVLVNGVSVGAVTSYPFAAVFANQTISASFAANPVDQTPPVATLLSPTGGESWAVGSAHAITWSATDDIGVTAIDLAYSTDGGATFPNAIATGLSNTGNYAWTVPSVLSSTVRVRVRARDAVGRVGSDSSHTNVAFTGWTIAASAGANGSIAPSGSVVVADGATPSFAITPNAGYQVNDVLVDGASVGAVTNYAFTAVHANHTIAASFSTLSFPVNVTIAGSGTVTKSPDQPTYATGTLVQLTANASPGWTFTGWSGDASGSANPLSVTVNSATNITATFAQHVYTWSAAGSAAFGTAANWTPARTTPATDDVLLFANGGSVTATGVTTQTIGQLRVSGNTNVNLQAAAAATLTLAGGAGADLLMAPGTTLTLSGASAITLAVGSGATGQVSGAIVATGAAHRVTATDAGSLVFANGGSASASTGFTGNLFGTTALNTVVFQNGSLYVQAAGANPFGAAAPSSVVAFQPGSRYRFDGGPAPSFSNRTYADFEYNSSGSQSPTGGNPFTCDSLIVTQGTLNLNLLGGTVIRGNLNVKAGATLGLTAAGATNYTFAGTNSQNIQIAGTLSALATSNVIVNNAAGVTLSSALTLPGTLTFTSGRVNTGGNLLTIAAGGSIAGAAQGTGWVNGRLQRNIAGGAVDVTFDVGDAAYYTPVLYGAETSVGAYDVIASVTAGAHPNIAGSTLDPAFAVQRYVTLSSPNAAGLFTYHLTYNFRAAELTAPPGAGTVFSAARFASSLWSPVNVGGSTATSATLNALTGFGDLVAGYVPFTITASSSPALTGTISPNGPVAVRFGQNQSFTITPASGYRVADVKVDGASVGAVTNYSFTNVQAAHTIAAEFATDAWVLDVGITGSGSVVRSPDLTGYTTGQQVQLTASPEAGFAFLGWSGDTTAFANPLTLTMHSDRNLIATFIDVAAPIVQVTSPNGGESWPQGSVHPITWSAVDNVGVDSVSVQFSTHGNAGPWVTLVHGAANNGSFAWTVPSSSTDSLLARVIAYDHAQNSGSDVSDSLARIPSNTTAVGPDGPAVFMLARPMPNPSVGAATLQFSLPEAGQATLEILDVEGRRVTALEGRFTAGPHTWTWDGRHHGDVQSHAGLYFVRLTTAWGKRTERMIRL